jgi:hypothetical protein
VGGPKLAPVVQRTVLMTFARRRQSWVRLLCVLLAGSWFALPRPAYACGAGTGGAAGITGCSLAEHEEEARPKWRVGAGYAFTSTGLHFGNGLRVDEVRNSSVVVGDYSPYRRLTLEAGVGPFLGGSITAPAGRFSLSPGVAAELGGSWRLIDADGGIPFVLLTAQLSYISSSAPAGVGYNAFDLRGGAVVGWSLWSAVAPYVVGRGFGGPVYWRYLGTAVVGTDDHHWQVGAGVSVRLGRFDVFAEGVPLGEQGVTAGAGYSF